MSACSRRYDPPIGPEEYDELCSRVSAVVRDVTPPGAVVAVVNKGDPRLLEIEGRTGSHFPVDAEGRYAGFHPRTSEDAVAGVESLRAGGADFLCLPATASWWLDHYRGLADWLAAHCWVAAQVPGTCVVYDLLRPPGAEPLVAEVEPDGAVVAQVQSLLAALLPEGALLLVVGDHPEGLSLPGLSVTPLGPHPAVALRRLTRLADDRPTYVLVARDAPAAGLDPALASFLERETEPVARREGLCDLLRMRSAAARQPGDGRDHSDPDLPSRSGAALDGSIAGELSTRLERLGLPGRGSSDEAVWPISEERPR